MKKQYFKPDILFEDFTMSTSISAGCDRITNTPSQGMCGVLFDNGFVFLEGINGCTIQPVDGSGAYNGLCYHVPYDDSALFNS